MANENPTWGGPRIHGELLKLGFNVAQSTVSKYLRRRQRPPSSTWKTFLENHAHELASIDFFAVPTATFKVLYGFVVLLHARRKLVHVAATEHPTAEWAKQQLRNAFPDDTAPRFVIHDRDAIFGSAFSSACASFGIEEIVTAPRSPWQNAYAERVIGSIRRELLDHVIVVDERHLTRLLRGYQRYYNSARTHLALAKDAPEPRALDGPANGERIVAVPFVGGLHHRYERRP